MFNNIKKLFKKEKVKPLPIPVSEVLEIKPKKKVELHIENKPQYLFFNEVPIINYNKTFFKEPKSTEFRDFDGWIFNDLSGKHFKTDPNNLAKGLDQIACKDFIYSHKTI